MFAGYKFFSRWEWACRCGCGFDTVDAELLYVMAQHVRMYYNSPVTITGPNRCFTYNLSTPGAAKNSMHIHGKANDFVVEGVAPIAVYHYLDNLFPNKYGLGLYPDRVHFDVRPDKARWKRM